MGDLNIELPTESIVVIRNLDLGKQTGVPMDEEVNMALNIQHVKTLVKITSSKIQIGSAINSTELILVNESVGSEIPMSACYQDPLTHWVSKTLELEVQTNLERKLIQFVRERWNGDVNTTVPRFALFTRGVDASAGAPEKQAEGKFKPLALSCRGQDVRNNQTLLDVHAHGANIKPLYAMILENESLKTDFEKVASALPCGSKGQKENSLTTAIVTLKETLQSHKKPTSFEYATIGMRLDLLPPPNHLCKDHSMPGMENCQVTFHNRDGAHLKFPRKGAQGRQIDENVLVDLIRDHLKKPVEK